MKCLKYALCAVVVFLASFTMAANFKVNTAKSKIKWVGKKVTGKHFGFISIKSGSFKFDKKKLVSGDISVDMKSIMVEDVKDPKWNKKLKDHLESKDFFHSSKHPLSKFKITKVDGEKVIGKMTIRGVTKEVQLPVKIVIKDDTLTAKAKVTIDRTDYGLKYKSGKFLKSLGDKMIYDNFNLELNLVANK